MRLDSSASSPQCGRPIPMRARHRCAVGEWQQRLKDFCSSRDREAGPRCERREQASEQAVWPDLKEPCSAITYKNCHKVTLLNYKGLRKLAAASCYNSRIIIITLERKAFKNTVKWLAEVRECTAAGIAIGESQGENCFSTHSCTRAFILHKLIMWQEATNRNVKHHSLSDNGKASLQ